MIDLFVIEFPYQNITGFLFMALVIFTLLEFAVRVVPAVFFFWKTRGMRKSIGEFKETINTAEKKYGLDEHLTSMKTRLEEMEKTIQKTYMQFL